MNKSRAQNIKLGIFVIIGTVSLVVAAVMIGNQQSLFGGTFQLSAVFQNINGLAEGNNVRFSGINVGTVKSIVMENDSTIHVNMSIDEEMQEHIKGNAIATIGSDGLVGSMLVNITPSGGGGSSLNDGDEIMTYSRIATDDMMSTLSVSNENIALLTKDLLDLTESLNAGDGTIGALLHDPELAIGLKSTVKHLDATSRFAESMMKDLSAIVKGINKTDNVAHTLLVDTLMGQKLGDFIGNLEMASEDMKMMSSDLKEVISELKQSEGGLNRLLTDSAFSQSIDRTVINLEKGSELLNEDLEALQHNFLLRRYFKKKKRDKK